MIPYGAEIRTDLSPEYIQNQGLQPHQYYLLVTRFVPENNALFIIKNFLKAKTDKPLVVLGKNYYRSAYEDEIMRSGSEFSSWAYRR